MDFEAFVEGKAWKLDGVVGRSRCGPTETRKEAAERKDRHRAKAEGVGPEEGPRVDVGGTVCSSMHGFEVRGYVGAE